MKKIILIVLLLALSYGSYYLFTLPESPMAYKTITYKMAPVEVEEVSRRYSRTVYYLIAQDGTMLTVDMRTYARTEPGQRIGSRHWKD